jgi:hypothetical protein
MLDAGDPDWRKKLRPNLTGDEAMRFAVRDIAEERRMLADEVTILRAAQPVGVPDGWVMVPREPTSAMLQAAEDADDDENMPGQSYSCIYSAMLAAAPQPPAQPSADAEDDFTEWLDNDWPLWRNDPNNPNVARLRRAWIAARAAEGDGK